MLYSIVSDPLASAAELNHDLEQINAWAYQWKMSFNPDPTKQAVEITFSQKKVKPCHPPLYFNGSLVKIVSNHKHLGLILDSNLSFSYHIDEKIATAKRGIGIIKHLSNYCPVKTLDQIYKMFVRPYLDYYDVIYNAPFIVNEFDSLITLPHSMERLERVQYQAALAVT